MSDAYAPARPAAPHRGDRPGPCRLWRAGALDAADRPRGTVAVRARVVAIRAERAGRRHRDRPPRPGRRPDDPGRRLRSRSGDGQRGRCPGVDDLLRGRPDPRAPSARNRRDRPRGPAVPERPVCDTSPCSRESLDTATVVGWVDGVASSVSMDSRTKVVQVRSPVSAAAWPSPGSNAPPSADRPAVPGAPAEIAALPPLPSCGETEFDQPRGPACVLQGRGAGGTSGRAARASLLDRRGSGRLAGPLRRPWSGAAVRARLRELVADGRRADPRGSDGRLELRPVDGYADGPPRLTPPLSNGRPPRMRRMLDMHRPPKPLPRQQPCIRRGDRGVSRDRHTRRVPTAAEETRRTLTPLGCSTT